MSYYKLGDRVKLIKVSPDNKEIKVGDEGTIINRISAHLYRIELDNGSSLDLKARKFEKVS